MLITPFSFNGTNTSRTSKKEFHTPHFKEGFFKKITQKLKHTDHLTLKVSNQHFSTLSLPNVSNAFQNPLYSPLNPFSSCLSNDSDSNKLQLIESKLKCLTQDSHSISNNIFMDTQTHTPDCSTPIPVFRQPFHSIEESIKTEYTITSSLNTSLTPSKNSSTVAINVSQSSQLPPNILFRTQENDISPQSGVRIQKRHRFMDQTAFNFSMGSSIHACLQTSKFDSIPLTGQYDVNSNSAQSPSQFVNMSPEIKTNQNLDNFGEIISHSNSTTPLSRYNSFNQSNNSLNGTKISNSYISDQNIDPSFSFYSSNVKSNRLFDICTSNSFYIPNDDEEQTLYVPIKKRGILRKFIIRKASIFFKKDFFHSSYEDIVDIKLNKKRAQLYTLKQKKSLTDKEIISRKRILKEIRELTKAQRSCKLAKRGIEDFSTSKEFTRPIHKFSNSMKDEVLQFLNLDSLGLTFSIV